QRHRVEVRRPGVRGAGDPVHAGDDRGGGHEHPAQQVDDHREQDDQQDHVTDPLEGHDGLLSATIAALAAMPGRAPVMIANCALIASTAGLSGARWPDSTPSSASASVASVVEVKARLARVSRGPPAGTTTK